MARAYKKIASNGHIRAKKILACEVCNFFEPYQSKNKLRTGSECPRCKNKTLRVFDSTAEFTRGRLLKMKQDVGEIENLEYQPKFPLVAPVLVKELDGVEPEDADWNETVHLYDFVADFAYSIPETGEFIVEDVKGSSRGKPIITDVAMMKIKHFEAQYSCKVNIVAD